MLYWWGGVLKLTCGKRGGRGVLWLLSGVFFLIFVLMIPRQEVCIGRGFQRR